MRTLTLSLCLLAGVTASVSAGDGKGGGKGGPGIPTTLDFSGTTTLNAEIITFIGSDMVSAADAAFIGTITLSSSDFSDFPGDLQLVDFDLMFVPTVELSGSVDGGKFLGSADPVGLSLAGMSYELMGPMPLLEGGGAVNFGFPATLSGNAFATYNLIGIEPQTGRIIDFSNIDPSNALLEINALSTNMGTLTLDAALRINTVTIPFEPGLVEIEFRFSPNRLGISATGEDPTADLVDICSRADIAEPCGVLDLADITTFVSGFTTQEPISDFNGDGIFDLDDIVGFVTAFTSDECDSKVEYYCYGYDMKFGEGEAAYAMGDHTMLTAGIAVSGAALMLGFGSFRRKNA